MVRIAMTPKGAATRIVRTIQERQDLDGIIVSSHTGRNSSNQILNKVAAILVD